MPSAAENLKANFRASESNFRASECRAELVRAMPSAAENLKVNFRASEIIELVKIRATYKVAFIKRFIICVNS